MSIYNLNGNTLNVNELNMGALTASAGVDQINLGAGGTINVTNFFDMGGSTDGVDGNAMTVSTGQTLDIGFDLRVASNGGVSAKTTFTLDGGSLVVGRDFHVSNNTGTGVVDFDDVSGLSWGSGAASDLLIYRNATVNHNDAVNTLTVPGQVHVGAGTGESTFDLNGNTLSAGSVQMGAAAPTAGIDQFIFDGGTVALTGDFRMNGATDAAGKYRDGR